MLPPEPQTLGTRIYHLATLTLFSGAAVLGALRGWIVTNRTGLDWFLNGVMGAVSAVMVTFVLFIVGAFVREQIARLIWPPAKPPPPRPKSPSPAALTEWFVSPDGPKEYDSYAAVFVAEMHLGRTRADAELAATRAVHDEQRGDEQAKREASAAISSAFAVVAQHGLERRVAAVANSLEDEAAEHRAFMTLLENAPPSSEPLPPEPEIPRIAAGALTHEQAVAANRAAIAELEWLSSEEGQLRDDASPDEVRSRSERFHRALFAVVDTDPARHRG